MEIAKERLARGYSQTAETYDRVAGSLYVAGIRRLLPRLAPPPYPAILDLGCGTGLNLLEAARTFAPTRYLAGIDLSEGMVQVARGKLAQAGLMADIVHGDAEQLPWPDETFDVVLANSVFHWFANRARALAEMRRVLRPGGQIALICAAHPAFIEWFRLLEDVMRRVLGSQTPSVTPTLPTVWEIIDLVHQTSLEGEYLNYPTQLQPVVDQAGFYHMMATVAPHWAADLDPISREFVLHAMQQTASLLFPQGMPVTWAAIELVARKPHG